jgi:hypothetical protein
MIWKSSNMRATRQQAYSSQILKQPVLAGDAVQSLLCVAEITLSGADSIDEELDCLMNCFFFVADGEAE